MAKTDAAEAKPTVELDVEEFSQLVVGMSRMLTGFTRISVFTDSQLSLAEWVAMTILRQRDGVTNKFLGRALGVTGQRANQICASLVRSGFVVVGQSAEDNRANDIKLTEAGKSKLDLMNSQLKPLLAGALEGKERSLAGATKHLRIVSRIVDAGRGGDPEQKKEKRKSKKAGKEKSQAA
jgi:DNA-binding MarR family transcriptional regulator